MAVKQRFPWIGVSAVIAFVVVMVTAWVQIPVSPKLPAPVGPLTSLQFKIPGDDAESQLLAEKLDAYDPRPLFVPLWMSSSGSADEARSGRLVSGPFAELPSELTKDGPVRFPSLVPLPVEGVAVLKLTERPNAPLGIARAETVGVPLVQRLACVEAVDTGGAVVLSLELASAADFPGKDWAPLELLGSVGRAGLVGELALLAGSGSDEIDNYFRSLLGKNMRIGERLPVGFYTFRVGP